jgi:hypothetical protein
VLIRWLDSEEEGPKVRLLEIVGKNRRIESSEGQYYEVTGHDEL